MSATFALKHASSQLDLAQDFPDQQRLQENPHGEASVVADTSLRTLSGVIRRST